MFRFLKNVLVFLGLLVVANGLWLECNFVFTNQGELGRTYTCLANIVSIGDERSVSEMYGEHVDGQNDSSVHALLYNQIINFTPRNISSFFPNLRVLQANSINSSELRREDLEGFKSLTSLRFANNNLREIDNDLFIKNPLLTSIYFEHNPIRHVAHNVFDSLTELNTLYMFNTSCTSKFAANNRSDVELLKFRLLLECPPTFRMTEERIVNGDALSDKVKFQIDNELDIFYTKLEAMEEQQSDLEQRVKVLEQNGNQHH